MKRAAVLAALALAGCGANASAGSPRLNPSQEVRVADANLALAKFCVAQLTNGNPPLPAMSAEDKGILTLIEVFRANPRAVYQPGHKGPARTMREVLSDEANSLDSCDPVASRQLDRALAATP